MGDPPPTPRARPTELTPGAHWSPLLGEYSRAQYPECDLSRFFSDRPAPARPYSDPPPDSAQHWPTAFQEEFLRCGFAAPAPPDTRVTCVVYAAFTDKWRAICNARLASHLISKGKAPISTDMFSVHRLHRDRPILAAQHPIRFLSRDVGNCYMSTGLPTCLQGKFCYLFKAQKFVYLVMPFGFSGAMAMLDEYPFTPPAYAPPRSKP